MLLNKKTQISIYTLNQLMSVNFHIGDKTYKWNALIKNLLFGGRHGVYYFNLKKTFPFLNRFLYFFKKTMESHQLLLFIAQHEFIHVILEFLISNTDYFASTEKWVGGTLTNWKMIKSYIYKLFTMTSIDIEIANYLRTDQKIQQKINRYAQMRLLLYGFRLLPSLPNIIILFNQQDSDQSSFFEALILNIPIISIVNTKSNAFGITYPIFSNDNTFESLFFISNLMYNCIINAFYQRRLVFFTNTYSMYLKMLKKKNIKNLKINPLLFLYKTELFLSKNKTFKTFKIKKILRKNAFLVKYHKQKISLNNAKI